MEEGPSRGYRERLTEQDPSRLVEDTGGPAQAVVESQDGEVVGIVATGQANETGATWAQREGVEVGEVRKRDGDGGSDSIERDWDQDTFDDQEDDDDNDEDFDDLDDFDPYDDPDDSYFL
ncbi:uncharacterized protein LTR77_000026 [Saxophila tyrrhenica]|uniref:Uncharacterized protein n=1 Tax=Saxophila tyrrhenica TaxID=1690608 RepID=A0AAV9PRD6_9PEZI|nr:hypothetical protein LTR77_000026 [Saxophila tyrrhenica]